MTSDDIVADHYERADLVASIAAAAEAAGLSIDTLTEPDLAPVGEFHVGGRAEKASVDADDERILERLRPWLTRDGLHFVGIDVIGGLLTEVNVTSPTGIQEMNALDGTCYEERVIERVERRIEERAD